MAISKATLLKTLKEARKEQDKRNVQKYVAQVEGKALSTNDYTTDEKTKLSGVAEGAQVNVIEKVSVDGSPLEITEKGINIDLTPYAKASDLTTVYRIKGTVETFAELPSDAKEGDVYNITAADKEHNIKAGDNVVRTSDGNWDNLSGITDLSDYVQKDGAKVLSTNDYTNEDKAKLDALEASKDEQVTSEEIAAIFADE